MSKTADLRKGMVIRHQGHLLFVEDYSVARTGKQRATVHVKLRALKDGHSVERSLDELGHVEEVPSEMRTMQYLYAAGDKRVFMDAETYEQYEVGAEIIAQAEPFLVEEQTYRFMTIEGQIASLQMPDVIVLEVIDTSPVEHAGGSTNVHKEAKLASGITVQVPLFIKNGDKIRVSTAHREYLGKDKEH